jgi:hypothetical protein
VVFTGMKFPASCGAYTMEVGITYIDPRATMWIASLGTCVRSKDVQRKSEENDVISSYLNVFLSTYIFPAIFTNNQQHSYQYHN